MTDKSTPRKDQASSKPMPLLALSALGVVFGDLGTSPLYTLQTVVQATGGKFTPESALGILSLVFWTLIITVSVKYCIFVMRADNDGEGGILALMSLVGANALKGRTAIFAACGLIGAALIYGDGVITPAISVLSALEGVNVATTAFKPYVMPTAVLILLTLFGVQRFGTAKIGAAFGPVMLAWFVVIAVLGVVGVLSEPRVLGAVNPLHAIHFILKGGPTTLLVLGGVFLCVTGGEALYADMGHFGRLPVRCGWFVVVLPALLLSYAGQTALLIQKGSLQGNPFYQLGPGWTVYPLVVLATVATIIASQSIVTGAFSMTRQAINLGWLPSMKINQTSSEAYGQIYVPLINRLMMVATIAVTIGFGSSDRLAGAYGTAVSTTMMLTTVLLSLAMIKVWRWPLAAAIPLIALFGVVDVGFFAANLLKIVDGGWLPLSAGALVFAVMTTWRYGVDALRSSLATRSQTMREFLDLLAKKKTVRTPGVGVFLTRNDRDIPPSVINHVRDMRAIYETVIIVKVQLEEIPRVTETERTRVISEQDGIWRVAIRFGYIEVPDIQAALSTIDAFDGKVDLKDAIYFSARDLLICTSGASLLTKLRTSAFIFLERNAERVVDRFRLPPEQVIEITRQVCS